MRGNGTRAVGESEIRNGARRWGNSSGSRIPFAHQAKLGAARGRTKQEPIRGQRKQREADLAETLSLEERKKQKRDAQICSS